MKVLKLTGALLDYWVARAEGIEAERLSVRLTPEVVEDACIRDDIFKFNPSESWTLGGPIIERAHIGFAQMFFRGPPGGWTAYVNARGTVVGLDGDFDADGPTQLIAAMRAYVASKFGNEVPDAPA
ncbi:phage protein NinX family protein [Burkholderia sp. BCC0097]|uniref:phage protein NinX family protein n=1 Tax=Burkholderia sp. BCC0097 TaxID=2676289 RepID=UPI00158C0547|nr:phage protein NinX family protein [Burkholderia sp. BCC0097]